MNVLFVCTGNVCRSPMAEGFLRAEGRERDLRVAVRSTGTHAWHGRAATIEGRRVMNELGTSIDDHRTREFDRELVDWADLIIALAFEHEREIIRDHPDAAAKTFTLKGFLHVLDELPVFTDASSWVAAASAAREATEPPTDTDVDDPFGERQTAYQRVATEIQGLVAHLAEGMQTKRVIQTT